MWEAGLSPTSCRILTELYGVVYLAVTKKVLGSRYFGKREGQNDQRPKTLILGYQDFPKATQALRKSLWISSCAPPFSMLVWQLLKRTFFQAKSV